VAKVILRFYGRFMCAVEMSDGAPTGSIHLVAPRFDETKFRRHTTMLSIATMNVDSRATDIPPTTMISAPQAVEAGRAETVLWDLGDRQVKLAGAESSATLGVSPHSPDFPLLDLHELVQLGRSDPAPANPVALNLDVLSIGYATQAVVHVNQGRGVVHRVLRPEITRDLNRRKLGDEGLFVTVKDANDKQSSLDDTHFGHRDETGALVESGIGEVIEFETEIETLTRFTFEISDKTGKRLGTIAMRAIVDEQVLTASFSSLCASLPRNEDYDLEFEQYYSALTKDSNPGELALLPKPTDDGGEPASCQAPVRFRFEKNSGVAV
jgi:hypothetical protein